MLNYTSIDTYAYTYDSAGNILTEKKNGTTVNAYTYSTGPQDRGRFSVLTEKVRIFR